MGGVRRHLHWLAIAAVAVSSLVVRAEMQVAQVTFETPEPTPETVTDEADFPYLSRISGTALTRTARIDEPLEVRPASADREAMLAGSSFVQKSYTAPHNVWDQAFVALYRDALALRGWRIVDEPPATAAESEPHVINVAAHYAASGRDLYARVSRTPDGSYQISVADVGAEDWGAMLDAACHIPIFSIHFRKDLRLDYEESRPSLEKLGALIRSRRDLRVQVQGHTDNIGDEKDLVTESSHRAMLVSAALQKLGGVPGDRMTTMGYGKSRPIVPNDTDWGRTKNRRIEIAKQPCG